MKPGPAWYVGLGWAGDTDALAFKTIRPKHAVAGTYGAIARLGELGHPFKAPLNCTAVAGTLNHFHHLPSILIRRLGGTTNMPWSGHRDSSN